MRLVYTIVQACQQYFGVEVGCSRGMIYGVSPFKHPPSTANGISTPGNTSVSLMSTNDFQMSGELPYLSKSWKL